MLYQGQSGLWLLPNMSTIQASPHPTFLGIFVLDLRVLHVLFYDLLLFFPSYVVYKYTAVYLTILSLWGLLVCFWFAAFTDCSNVNLLSTSPTVHVQDFPQRGARNLLSAGRGEHTSYFLWSGS